MKRRNFMAFTAGIVGLFAADRQACATTNRNLFSSKTPVKTPSGFKNHLNETFVAQCPQGNRFDLKLIEVEDVSPANSNPRAKAPKIQSISLLFEGTPHTPMIQEIYKLSHPTMAKQEYLMVPVATFDPAVRHYEIILSAMAGV